MPLTRADLESGVLQAMVLQSGLDLPCLSEADLQDSIRQTLQRRPSQSDVWIFAYGSLIWNPIFPYVDRRVGTIYGWHRRFCLWTQVGRGTPENPGLVLGLDRGGSCRGVAFQLDPSDLLVELLLVWRREMVLGAYNPGWVKVFDGQQEREAIAFITNRQHPNYAGTLALSTTIERLATATGPIGSCADYLLQTVEGLLGAGIHDKTLMLLRDRVLAQAPRPNPSTVP